MLQQVDLQCYIRELSCYMKKKKLPTYSGIAMMTEDNCLLKIDMLYIIHNLPSICDFEGEVKDKTGRVVRSDCHEGRTISITGQYFRGAHMSKH